MLESQRDQEERRRTLDNDRRYRTQYEFNVVNHRFLKIAIGQYVDGGDENSDTPSVSGGLCTKISQ
jgi:hypothetical protein